MKKLAATGTLLFLLAGWAGAQEVMTLEQAVSIGLTNNYGIIISQNEQKEAKNNATPGNAGMLPAVGVNAGLVKGVYAAKVKVISGTELDNPSAKSDLITAGAGLTWRVFDGLKMFITLDKLKKVEEVSDLSAKITIENTMARIIGAYYEIVKQGRVLQFLTEQVEISKLRLDLAKIRFETGKGSEMEYLKGRVELNADIASLSSQKTLYENSKTNLNELLCRKIPMQFAVLDTIPVGEPLDYDTLLNSVKASNKNLLMSIRTKEIGALNVKSARASQWPTLDYFAGYNYYHSDTEANFIQLNQNFGPSFGLTFNMKLFDGLNLKRQYNNAVISLQSDDLGVKQMENRLESTLAKMYNEYHNQQEMVDFEQQNLVLAVRNMDLAKTSYAVGSISSFQLREVQDDLLKARNRLVTAQFRLKLTETDLLLLSGQLLH
jgi:outer membrane protein TolC